MLQDTRIALFLFSSGSASASPEQIQQEITYRRDTEAQELDVKYSEREAALHHKQPVPRSL